MKIFSNHSGILWSLFSARLLLEISISRMDQLELS